MGELPPGQGKNDDKCMLIKDCMAIDCFMTLCVNSFWISLEEGEQLWQSFLRLLRFARICMCHDCQHNNID
jgi:hypothetical protein